MERRNIFVSINLIHPTRKRRKLVDIKQLKGVLKSNIPTIISGLTLLAIPVSYYLGNQIIADTKKKIATVNKEISIINREIAQVRREQQVWKKRFFDFYLPELPKTVFQFWLTKQLNINKQFLKVSKNLYSIIGGNVPVNISMVFPNFSSISRKPRLIYPKFYVQMHQFKIGGETIVPSFLDLPKLGSTVETLSVYIPFTKEDASFFKKLSSIKSPKLKYSIFFEYLVLRHSVEELSKKAKMPLSFAFYLAGIFSSPQEMKKKIEALRKECNYLWLTKLVGKEYFLNNKPHGFFNFEAICVKNKF